MTHAKAIDVAGAARAIAQAATVTIVTHIRPDADAIGSACALAAALEKNGQRVHVVIGENGSIPENLRCIPGSSSIVFTGELPDADLIVTVDCASLDRTGALAPAIDTVKDHVLVIDHHVTNPGFGGMNLIANAESTTTILYDIIGELGIELDNTIAYCLYAGLLTDTGSFRWGTPHMHTLAAKLMEYGLDTRQISTDLMDAVTAEDLQHLGTVLSQIQVKEAHGLKLAVLVARDEHLSHMTQQAIEVLIDYVRVLIGTDVGVVFKEIAPEHWSVSLRSIAIDVSQVAGRLGGGGHKPAAGYSTSGAPEAVVDELIGVLA
ncbi:bifunctional oligoribonuclease/PAP phosphatase NrnA [Corynebacterium breve]|uniref:Bifunctional oligoribonuclease/PAP phosphatase NrnA n=1 Tax=Corynebacterium breve TaxID=3049799 RepID=A0ABY8VD15_9CORY|nr:bifunctional oligoribonuclease/PAP phosphatase NrnA [Corynebacterium breve]WIM66831.1 bifunctional oligoribonuclease/PAP phosphatase NrnA [Corynebacterium breve]